MRVENSQSILITGGNGFLGSAILKELTGPEAVISTKKIRAFDISIIGTKADQNVEYIKGDIQDYNEVLNACNGIDIVIHTAAIVDWGTRPVEEVLNINVNGTKNVLRACKEARVKVLVYTSSLDAVYTGKPMIDVDETVPYPDKHVSAYCRSKYLSEKLLLEDKDDFLQRCILRPSDIYGEADPYHIGSLIDIAKGGFYVRLGNGKSKCQHVYVGNMAHAHLLAAKALLEEKPGLDGSVYFITDGPADNFFKFFDKIITAAGYKIWPKNFWIPRGAAYFMGSISEFIALLLRPIKKYTPKFSRFAVTYTCTDYTFNSDKARREFGFMPKYSKEEALERTVNYFRKEK